MFSPIDIVSRRHCNLPSISQRGRNDRRNRRVWPRGYAISDLFQVIAIYTNLAVETSQILRVKLSWF